MQKERYQSQINQNFGTIWTEVCLTFSRLAAKLSEIIAKFRGRNLKIQHRTSFDLNGLKNGFANYFKNCIKLMHFFQGLIWRILLGDFVGDPNISSRHVWCPKVKKFGVPVVIGEDNPPLAIGLTDLPNIGGGQWSPMAPWVPA